MTCAVRCVNNLPLDWHVCCCRFRFPAYIIIDKLFPRVKVRIFPCTPLNCNVDTSKMLAFNMYHKTMLLRRTVLKALGAHVPISGMPDPTAGHSRAAVRTLLTRTRHHFWDEVEVGVWLVVFTPRWRRSANSLTLLDILSCHPFIA